jgi:hypothetical protein
MPVTVNVINNKVVTQMHRLFFLGLGLGAMFLGFSEMESWSLGKGDILVL